MHICLLKVYNPKYPDQVDYETSRLLSEITLKGYTSSVISLPQYLRVSAEQYGSYYSDGILHLDTPPNITLPTDAIPSLPDFVTTKAYQDSIPDIVLLRNSITLSSRVGYAMMFGNLKAANVTFVNDVEQHTKMGSKSEVYRALQEAGVPIPKTIIVPYFKSKPEEVTSSLFEEDLERVEQEVGYPCVVKLPYGFEGEQVALCFSKENVVDVVEDLVQKNSFLPIPEIIFQEYVPDSFHTYSAHIVGDFINADIRVGDPNNTNPFKASGMAGNMRLQYRVDAQLESITKAALAAIGLDFARFDFVKKDGQYLVLEANVSGTFTRTENCNRKNIAGALVDHAVAVHNSNKVTKT